MLNDMLASICACFVPVVAAVIVFKLLVSQQNTAHALLACLLGLLCVVPIAVMQIILNRLPVFSPSSILNVFITAIVFTGLVEETIKMLMLLLLPARTKSLAPFFACSLLFGLTLGCFENVIYLVNGTADLFLRMATSVPVHCVCAGLCGLYVWSFKKKEAHVMPFVYAVLVHGIYNFFAALPSSVTVCGKIPLNIFAMIAILFSLIEIRAWYLQLRQLH